MPNTQKWTDDPVQKIPDDKKGRGKNIRFASPGMWEKNLTQDEQQIMNKILSQTLSKLNYL